MSYGYDPNTGNYEIYNHRGRSDSGHYRRELDAYGGGGSSGGGGDGAGCLLVLIAAIVIGWNIRDKIPEIREQPSAEVQALGPLAPERIDPIAVRAMQELKAKIPKYDEALIRDLVEDWQETGDVPDLFKSFWRGTWLELYPSDRPSGIDPAYLDEIDTEGYRAMTRLFQNGYLNEEPQPQ